MIEKINQLKKENIPLFYITEGNPKAFKLFVRHISYAETLGLGKIIENTFVPNTTIYIVNWDMPWARSFSGGNGRINKET